MDPMFCRNIPGIHTVIHNQRCGTILQYLFGLNHGRRKPPIEAGHKKRRLLMSAIEIFYGRKFFREDREWFFYEDVLPGLQCLHDHLSMEVMSGSNQDKIYIR